MIHEDLLQSPLSTHHFIESFIQDLDVSMPKKGRKQGDSKATAPKWCPPPAGECKLNADAAVAKTTCRGAVGVVCRSFNGQYMGSSAVVFEGITDPWCLEAMACREAIALAEDLCRGEIMVALDCLEVIKGLEGQSLGLSSHILQEIKDSARERGGVSFRHESRASNTEAHELARYATSLPHGRHMWLGVVPAGMSFPVIIPNAEL
jgi:hypothetical protein